MAAIKVVDFGDPVNPLDDSKVASSNLPAKPREVALIVTETGTVVEIYKNGNLHKAYTLSESRQLETTPAGVRILPHPNENVLNYFEIKLNELKDNFGANTPQELILKLNELGAFKKGGGGAKVINEVSGNLPLDPKANKIYLLKNSLDVNNFPNGIYVTDDSGAYIFQGEEGAGVYVFENASEIMPNQLNIPNGRLILAKAYDANNGNAVKDAGLYQKIGGGIQKIQGFLTNDYNTYIITSSQNLQWYHENATIVAQSDLTLTIDANLPSTFRTYLVIDGDFTVNFQAVNGAVLKINGNVLKGNLNTAYIFRSSNNFYILGNTETVL